MTSSASSPPSCLVGGGEQVHFNATRTEDFFPLNIKLMSKRNYLFAGFELISCSKDKS